MIKRIVKMTFKEDKVKEFIEIFKAASPKISSCVGCKGVKLLQDKNKANVFFTYSLWETEDNLDDYRQSELFKKTWSLTKVLFDSKPEAWSTIEK